MAGSPNDPPQLNASEIELLAVLASGVKDSVAEAKLGLSRRTLRRRLRAVMDKIGASSRFEAGYIYAALERDRGGDG